MSAGLPNEGLVMCLIVGVGGFCMPVMPIRDNLRSRH